MYKLTSIGLSAACGLLASSLASAQTLQLLPIQGSPSTTPIPPLGNSSAGFEGLTEVTMPDLDGNGISEIAVAYYDAPQSSVIVEIFYNGALTSVQVPVGLPPTGVASLDAGDMDGDGVVDLVVTLQPTAGAAATAIFYSNTGGVVQPIGPLVLPGMGLTERIHDVQVANVNGTTPLIAGGAPLADLVIATATPGAADRVHSLALVGAAAFAPIVPAVATLGGSSSSGSTTRARITLGDVNNAPGLDATLRTGPTGALGSGIQMLINGGAGAFVPTFNFLGAPYDSATDLQSATLDTTAPGDLVAADVLVGNHLFQVGLLAGGLTAVTAVPPTSIALNASGVTGSGALTTDIVAVDFNQVGLSGNGVAHPMDVFSCDNLGSITGFFNDQAPPPVAGSPATFNTQIGFTPILTIPGAPLPLPPILNSIAAGNLNGNTFSDLATCSRDGRLWRILF